ncbi:MAG: cytochrome C oxidase subunit IV family protein [Deltaproteobacteria bacterium]|nr:cytochrome C oxidase subunit IV family protein [Deltaproteobacteria bacterium]
MKRLIQKIFGKGDYHGHSGVYFAVWMALLALTGITVGVSYYNFGDWNIFVAMLVATIKAALVCLYFMHLKYDNKVNAVVFASGIFCLAVFIILTATDELFRRTEMPPRALAAADGGVNEAEVKKYLESTPELLKKGGEIYAMQCAVCHGAQGKGDGPASQIQPPPRDFTSGYWKFGGGPIQVFQTITKGSPGTSMASFSSLSVEERFSLAHTVRQFAPNPPADPADALASLTKGSAPAVAKPVLKIPVSFAKERYIISPSDN